MPESQDASSGSAGGLGGGGSGLAVSGLVQRPMSRKRRAASPPLPRSSCGLSSFLWILQGTQKVPTEWLSAQPPHQAWLARDTGHGHVPAITATLTQ